jgi:hypothetical protein
MFGTIRKHWRNYLRVSGAMDPATEIKQELAEAKIELLHAETAQDWADSQVGYHLARVNRLTHSLNVLERGGQVFPLEKVGPNARH